MEISEIFYLVGIVTMVFVSVLLGVLVYQIILTLKTIQKIADRTTNIAQNLSSVTTGIQFGFWSLLSNLFKNIRRGGDE